MILVQLSGLRWPRPAVTQTEVKAAMEGIRSRKIYLRREVRVGENLSSDFLDSTVNAYQRSVKET